VVILLIYQKKLGKTQLLCYVLIMKEEIPIPENIDAVIEGLLNRLRENFDIYDQLSPELQSMWDDFEWGADVDKDREGAKANLVWLLETLKLERVKIKSSN